MAYWIGDRISKFRNARNLTQKELGELIGASSTRVSNWEQGANRPNVEFLVKICEALGVTPSEMLDFQLPQDDLNDMERSVIAQYRKKPDLRRAVNILLGIEGDKED
jgi:transcriptional regulator with XRE-family HTH domain